MAYGSTITYDGSFRGGCRIRVVEAEAAAASESDAISVPTKFTVLAFSATLGNGTGTTIDSRLGRAAGWTDGDDDELLADAVGAPSDRIHIGEMRSHFSAPSGEVFLRSNVDVGNDNDIITEFLIVEGWV